MCSAALSERLETSQLASTNALKCTQNPCPHRPVPPPNGPRLRQMLQPCKWVSSDWSHQKKRPKQRKIKLYSLLRTQWHTATITLNGSLLRWENILQFKWLRENIPGAAGWPEAWFPIKRFGTVTDRRMHSWPGLDPGCLIYIIAESGLQGQCQCSPALAQETPNTQAKSCWSPG